MSGSPQPSDASSGTMLTGDASLAASSRRPDATRRAGTAVSYIDAVAIALACRIVVAFLFFLLFNWVLTDPPRNDAVAVIGMAGVGTLLVGCVIGVRYARLSGWRSWVAVVALAVVAELVFAVVADTLTEATGEKVVGEAAYYVLLAAVVIWLVWRRRMRAAAAGSRDMR